MTMSNIHDIHDSSQFGSLSHMSLGPMTDSTFPPSLVADPWAPESQVPPGLVQPTGDVQVTGKAPTAMPEIDPRPEFGVSELNNAYEGGLEGLGLDSSVVYGMGLDQNLWIPNNDWLGVEALNGGVGA